MATAAAGHAIKVAQNNAPVLIPREHGATAMLLTPFFAAAILLRRFDWPELMALAAIASAFAIKDPLVVIARQRFVWKQEHEETRGARRAVAIEGLVLAICGIVLTLARDWRPFVPLFAGAAGFTALAVTLNVRNKQRSVWFQVASAIALTSTCIAVCLAAVGTVPKWCWILWLLCAVQATAGIFVVHARLDARIAARKQSASDNQNRRAAFVCVAALAVAAIFFAVTTSPWIGAALAIAAAGYSAELRRQLSHASLQMPLKRIGVEALSLSIAYALLVIVGLWRR